MIGNVTKSAVDKLSGGWLWDKSVVGFGARRQTNGVFYYIRYRAAGRQRMQSIGRHGVWTPDTARTKAKELLGIVAAGNDPSRDTQGESFGSVSERYLALCELAMKPRSYDEIVRHLRKHSKPLAKLRLTDIGRRAIAELLAQIESGSGPVARNRVRTSLSAFFTWAIAEGLLGDDGLNPVTGTAVADEGGKRKRVLTDAELTQIWHSLGTDRYSDIVRLLLLTGQRRQEIGGLRWDEIATGVDPATLLPFSSIRLPPERVKNSQEHTLPLSPQALAIISGQPRSNSAPDFVFGSFTGWSNAKAQLDARIARNAAPLQPWRLHDLRRTVATRLGDLGVLPHVVECILNHLGGFRSGVAGVYNLARFEPEMREALGKWSDYVSALACAEGVTAPLQSEIAAPAVTAPLRLRLVR